jgi:uncharacterized protein (DUF983 family)
VTDTSSRFDNAPSVLSGLKRGLTRHCPNCGQGRLFRGYLRVEPVCPACGNENGRYPADDGPAYFTMLLVGHLVIAPGLALILLRGWSPFVILGVSLPMVAGVCLAALPFIKGGWIGVLWGSGKYARLEPRKRQSSSAGARQC